ncbi:MAG: UDP-2,3-diacylglucosamine diphosphatase [Burkholderiales bacterium]
MDTTQAAHPATAALFISDLHLQASMSRTAQAFFDFMKHRATKAQQLYLLGDIFEYWAGDDDIDPFNRKVIDAIRAVSNAGVDVFWIAGNRDFLAGSTFAEASGITLLPDPFVAHIAGQQLVLTHGDAQCTDDTSYMAFRAQVRRPEWQKEFLARPLAQRKAIIAGMRQSSREAQCNKADEIMDVNPGAIAALYDATATAIMIHGHTHRPAQHVISGDNGTRARYVLPDWDYDAAIARGGWIAIAADGRITRFGADGQALP